jgi:hypothetical protein
VALVRHATDRFAALIGATAAVRDLDPSLIEKDYWAVEALRAVHGGFDVTVGEKTVHVQPIFKGGTSLSKAFGLIERFSEDIDLLVPVPAADPKDYSTKARSSLMKAATETVTASSVSAGSARLVAAASTSTGATHTTRSRATRRPSARSLLSASNSR